MSHPTDPEFRFRVALDHLFRALHNVSDPLARMALAGYVADFPGYAWCPDGRSPFVLPLAEVGDARVVMRAPETPEEVLDLARTPARTGWNPPRAARPMGGVPT